MNTEHSDGLGIFRRKTEGNRESIECTKLKPYHPSVELETTTVFVSGF